MAPTRLPPRPPFAVRLHDTPSRRVRPVEPITPGRIGMYTCGPTVYAPQHIGNMRSQLFADLLRRVLQASGLEVTAVINITDVGHLTDNASHGDDKLEVAAATAGRSAAEIAAHFTEQWLRDRRRLACLEPTVLCRATDHIDTQIAMVKLLEEKGYTYRTADGVYFDTSRWPRYADFAGLVLDEQWTSGRVANVEDKRNAADFALWKLSPPGERRQQEWDSPWGVGFPGWHIECSAMSTHYLGDRFDVHTGGVDHINVHHTNEVAQSEAALDVHPWVSLWVHHEFLQLGEAKMSKSEGASIVLDDLVAEGFEPLAFRWFFFQAHYRSQQEFSAALLEASARGLARLRQRAAAARDEGGEPDPDRCRPWRERFWQAMADDLNAPAAVAVVNEMMRSPDLSGADRWALLLDVDDALAMGFADLPADAADPTRPVGELDEDVARLLAEREEARSARDFSRADRIRDELASRGLRVVDTPDGPRVELAGAPSGTG